ncbi:MAG: DNA polymerase III subunit [Bacteroidales bacterium]|nr:DNA polymerase III subunit [Bacteroidales bacterium]
MFQSIIGQQDLKTRLIHSVKSGQMAHAQIFCGSEGVGAYSLAFAYAKYVHCTNRGETDACGECPSCKKYNKLIHPDLHFVFPIYKVAKSKKEICDDYLPEWREFNLKSNYFSLAQWMGFIGSENAQGMIYSKESQEILRKLSLKTYEAEYKIMIVWLPEKMNAECANKLLKIIEEPPAKTLFLLVAEETENILPTILSRAQRINVRPIENSVMIELLCSNYGLTQQDAASVAHIATGSFLKAEETIQLSENQAQFFDYFTRYMRLAYTVANMKKADNPMLKFEALRDLKSVADEIAGIGREKQKQFLAYCQHFLRENFIRNLQVPSISYLNNTENGFAAKFSPYIHAGNVYGFMENFDEAEKQIEQNVNAKMIFFDLALKAIMLLKS